jgi:hypothetical protein
VVAADEEELDPGARQPSGFAHEELARGVILPVAVVEVAGDDHERRFLGDRGLDEVGEGLARGGREQPRRLLAARPQAPQRAVQMDVGGMQESK